MRRILALAALVSLPILLLELVVALTVEFGRPKPAQASAGTPWTVAFIPDAQFLAGDSTCGGTTIYNTLIQWLVTNKNLSVNSTPLNIKAVVQLGDTVNTSTVNTTNAQQQAAVAAFHLAEQANIAVIHTPGNHDYSDGGGATLHRSNLSFVWRTDKSGDWQPSNLAATYGTGINLGSGDRAYWGGAYSEPNSNAPISSANAYYLLDIQGKHVVITALEFYPRTEVMAWAQSIANKYPDREWWVATHAYLSVDNAHTLSTYGGGFGPSTYGLADAATCPGTCTATDTLGSNSGSEMWNGSAGGGTNPWAGLVGAKNLTMVVGGHFTDGWAVGSNFWIWQRLAQTSTSSNGQTVQSIFSDAQGLTSTGDLANYCSGNPATPDGTTSAAHIFLLRFLPNTSQAEGMMLSANIGSGSMWIGPWSATLANNIKLASYGPLFTVAWPTPASVRRIFPVPNSVQ